MRFFSIEEVASLAEAMPAWAGALTLNAAYPGGRWDELDGLRRDNLDLMRGRVTVSESLSEVAGVFEVKELKTRAGQRSITLPEQLCPVLANHLEDVDEELVFPTEKGGYLRRSNFRQRTWRPAVRATVGEPMRFHGYNVGVFRYGLDYWTFSATFPDETAPSQVRTSINPVVSEGQLDQE